MGINIFRRFVPFNILIKPLSTHQNIWLTHLRLFYFFFTIYKNEQKEHKFRWQKIQKGPLQKQKSIQIDDIDDNKILVSKKESYGTKNAFQYFIGYNDNVIRPLCVRLVQMTGYARKFVENTTMSFRAINK